VFNRRDEFHRRANELESAARKLQDPEARRQLHDLSRQWRHMAEGWRSVFGEDNPARSETASKTSRSRSDKKRAADASDRPRRADGRRWEAPCPVPAATGLSTETMRPGRTQPSTEAIEMIRANNRVGAKRKEN